MKKNKVPKFLNQVKDKMQRFNFPDHWFVVEAKSMEEAQEKAKKIISKK